MGGEYLKDTRAWLGMKKASNQEIQKTKVVEHSNNRSQGVLLVANELLKISKLLILMLVEDYSLLI